MKAADIMTGDVAAVGPEARIGEIAALLVAHRISAVPVIDAERRVLGIVSEGDLVARDERARQERRDWWLTLLAEGSELNPDFLASLSRPEARARAVMSAPVVTVEEDTDIREIARLLTEYRIKRVPVVREGRLVGIVSRADLLRAMAGEAAEPAGPAPAGHDLFARLDRRLHPTHHGAAVPGAAEEAPPGAAGEGLQAGDFRHLVADFAHRQAQHQEAARRAASEERRARARELIDQHVSDGNWRALLHQARQAAEQGDKEFLLLRLPRELLSDGGRAVNAPEPDWPRTLRGEAAEVYLRWARDLKPRGFGLAARVLDFPGGMPGDIGLFLVWGE